MVTVWLRFWLRFGYATNVLVAFWLRNCRFWLRLRLRADLSREQFGYAPFGYVLVTVRSYCVREVAKTHFWLRFGYGRFTEE